MTKATTDKIDRKALLAEIEKIRDQRERRRMRARDRYVPYSVLEPAEKAKRLEYGRSYRQRQGAIMELGRELGIVEAQPPKRSLKRLPAMQEATPRKRR